MRTYALRTGIAAAMALAAFGLPVSVSAQAPASSAQTPSAAPASLAPQAPLPDPQARRLTLDDAVRLALENNLGLQVAPFNPQLQDLNLAIARAAYTPAFTTRFSQNGNNQPSTGFLSGSSTATHSNQFA